MLHHCYPGTRPLSTTSKDGSPCQLDALLRRGGPDKRADRQPAKPAALAFIWGGRRSPNSSDLVLGVAKPRPALSRLHAPPCPGKPDCYVYPGAVLLRSKGQGLGRSFKQ